MEKVISGAVIAIIIIILFMMFTGTAPKKPPIMLSFRPSLIAGKVLRVTNTSSGNLLECTMQAYNSEMNQSVTYTFRLYPRSTYEIGLLEADWKFEPGEHVSVKATGYVFPVKCTVP